MITNGVHGVLVPAGDSTALAEATCSLYNDPARRAELGKQARHLASQHFTNAAMAQSYANFYEQAWAEFGSEAARAEFHASR